MIYITAHNDGAPGLAIHLSCELCQMGEGITLALCPAHSSPRVPSVRPRLADVLSRLDSMIAFMADAKAGRDRWDRKSAERLRERARARASLRRCHCGD